MPVRCRPAWPPRRPPADAPPATAAARRAPPPRPRRAAAAPRQPHAAGVPLRDRTVHDPLQDERDHQPRAGGEDRPRTRRRTSAPAPAVRTATGAAASARRTVRPRRLRRPLRRSTPSSPRWQSSRATLRLTTDVLHLLFVRAESVLAPAVAAPRCFPTELLAHRRERFVSHTAAGRWSPYGRTSRGVRTWRGRGGLCSPWCVR